MSTPVVTKCQHCGAMNRVRATGLALDCWLCGATVEASPAPTELARARPEQQAGRTFGLSTLMLTVALFAVLFGVFREAPGLAILLAFAVAPGLLSVGIAQALRQPMTAARMVGTVFVVSIPTVVLGGVGGVIAFVWACSAAGGYGGVDYIRPQGILAGWVAAAIVAVPIVALFVYLGVRFATRDE